MVLKSLGRRIGSAGRAMATGAPKAARRVASASASAANSGSLLGMGTKSLIGIGAIGGGLGFANALGPSVRDAAFDVSMGDPNADVAFTGNKISARYMIGDAMGGPVGLGLRASAPLEYGTFSSPRPTGQQAVIGAGVGMGIGTALGFGAAALLKRGGLASVSMINGGAFAGAAIGGLGGVAATRTLVQDNKRFYQESPYYRRNSSLNTMNNTNAVGDIVFGMHNSRRGY